MLYHILPHRCSIDLERMAVVSWYRPPPSCLHMKGLWEPTHGMVTGTLLGSLCNVSDKWNLAEERLKACPVNSHCGSNMRKGRNVLRDIQYFELHYIYLLRHNVEQSPRGWAQSCTCRPWCMTENGSCLKSHPKPLEACNALYQLVCWEGYPPHWCR